MKTIFVFLVSLLFAYPLFAQSDKLLGRWILDFALTEDNSLVPLDNPYFSNEVIYEISPNKMKISAFTFDTKYIGDNEIDLGHMKLSYTFSDGYLTVVEKGSKIKLYFLKRDDFVKKYPEFEEKRILSEGRELYVANTLSKLVFDNGTIDPNSFITNGAPLLKKKTSKNYFMKAAFVLDQHNQISNIVVSNIEEDDIREQVIKSIQRCGKFYKNYTGKDLLITLPFNFFKMYQFFDPETNRIYRAYQQGEEWFGKSEFEKAIFEYEKGIDTKIDMERYGNTFYHDYIIHLGIAYLVTDQKEKAASTFRKLGDETNFKIRNYLRFYCRS